MREHGLGKFCEKNWFEKFFENVYENYVRKINLGHVKCPVIDQSIRFLESLLYLMVLLKLIYRVNTETLRNEVSEVKDKTHHEKFSSWSKSL